ncbi:Spo0E like sporulation regulatory protein [Thermohydrogenium kirishiense]|nr:Spo0E like sporulation regulatory protein [Thermohydrogenium kirishiense]
MNFLVPNDKIVYAIFRKGELMMYNKISILEEQISNLRDELDDLIKQEEVKYDIVLDLSRKLDDLIVLYVTTKAKKYLSNGDIVQ